LFSGCNTLKSCKSGAIDSAVKTRTYDGYAINEILESPNFRWSSTENLKLQNMSACLVT